jgi:hypothetical protein
VKKSLTLKVLRECLFLTNVRRGTGEKQANGECRIALSELFLKYETQREGEIYT